MKLGYMLFFGALTACAPQDLVSGTTESGSARFSDYPDTLFAAFQAACSGPAHAFSRPARDAVECRELMPPDVTAALIVTYDGTPEDLPRLVIRFDAKRDAPGYLVRNDIFFNVPQREGGALQIRQPDPQLTQRLNRLYRRAGGVPERPA
ncbi:hypothetical protein [Thalassococcus sp. S3]|uniref:hypothetical protein n=1 Tax=Thalassococcus sp. S3 TaxID=2017482 RepID=UPI0010247913|nr:hypothetical protein [Thalassococcus sp. S3]QBF32116.1 hypothetical protein CFI11_12925 [Thalassococcus sp. S3]